MNEVAKERRVPAGLLQQTPPNSTITTTSQALRVSDNAKLGNGIHPYPI